MNNFYVYQYIDPRNNEPFYVGKGCNDRCYDHLNNVLNENYVELDNIEKHKRIKDILNNKQNPIITKIYDNIEEWLAFGIEKYFIKKIGRKDLGLGPLLNLTNGGDGFTSNDAKIRWSSLTVADKKKYYLNTLGKYYKNLDEKAKKSLFLRRAKSIQKNWDESPERKKKFSLMFTGNSNPFFGKTHSVETKQKLSKINKGKILSEQTKNNMADSWNKRREKDKTYKTLKKWKLMSPNGTEYVFTGGLRRFCKQFNELKSSHFLTEVAQGKREQYKGWKAEYIT